MYKAYLLIITTCLCHNLLAQQNPQQKFAGRWRTHLLGGQTDDLLFISDTKGAVISPDNRICAYFTYISGTVKNEIITYFTFEVERSKRQKREFVSITFLTDSTFLFHPYGASSLNSYFTKNDRFYTRMKPDITEQELHRATCRDLKGKWIGSINNFDAPGKNDKKYTKLFFVDEDHLVLMNGDSAHTATYKIDFTKQPSPIDFTYTNNGRTVPAFLMLIGTDKMRIQWFPNNNRGDHFTDIGSTMWFLRQKPINK